MTGSVDTFKSLLSRHWVSLLLALLVAAFSWKEPAFFSVRGFNNILISSTALVLLAAAETFVIITGGIDLSVGFVMGLSAVGTASVMEALYQRGQGASEPVSLLLGILAGIALGLVPGLINGLLVARLRVPPFIATLGMYGIANGVALRICGGFPVSFLPPLTGTIGNGYLAYLSPKAGLSWLRKPELLERADILAVSSLVPVSVLLAAAAVGACGFVLARTRFGRHTYAIGGSLEAARRAGINTPLHLIRVYVLSSFLAACAGVLLVLRFTTGNHTQQGASHELFAIAAVVIGGASLQGGSGTIARTVIGVLLLSTLEIGFVMLGIEVFYRYIAVGAILILAVFVDQLSERAGWRA